jgi:geranylgeranyl diphosphate synthase type II
MLNFEAPLTQALKRHVHHIGIYRAMDYAVMPPGKLFRPRLLEAVCTDLNVNSEKDILTLGCALEIHHAYTLVHDDMPCMDNDLTRRGKPTTHVAYGEWQALLTGDVLLALSYAELEKLHTPAAAFIRRFFHWATGAKGLILGQWIDLGHEGNKNAHLLMRMHELKTARLMQIATTGALALSNPKFNLKDLKRFLSLGNSIGLAFQLLDDLDDLCADILSDHEKAVNPFLQAPQEVRQRLTAVLTTLEKEKLPHTRQFLEAFLKKSAKGLIENQNKWSAYLPTEKAALVKLLTSGICA